MLNLMELCSSLIGLIHSFIFDHSIIVGLDLHYHHHWTVYTTILTMDFNTFKAAAVRLEFSAVQMARLLYYNI